MRNALAAFLSLSRTLASCACSLTVVLIMLLSVVHGLPANHSTHAMRIYFLVYTDTHIRLDGHIPHTVCMHCQMIWKDIKMIDMEMEIVWNIDKSMVFLFCIVTGWLYAMSIWFVHIAVRHLPRSFWMNSTEIMTATLYFCCCCRSRLGRCRNSARHCIQNSRADKKYEIANKQSKKWERKKRK